jgi:Xaa-Pro aminopeptidase
MIGKYHLSKESNRSWRTAGEWKMVNNLNRIYGRRIDRLRKAIRGEKFDTLLIMIPENRRYFSGFTGEDTGFNESAGALLITDRDLVLATDSRYMLQAQQQARAFEVVCYRKGLAKQLPDVLANLQTKVLGFESERLSYKQFREVEKELAASRLSILLEATDNLAEKLRVTKAPDELKATREALRLAESVFAEMVLRLKPGMSEKQAAWMMEKGLREAGADELSFPLICASGPNSALPHAVPGDRKICTEEPILFDWGVRLDGYCSDTSRTVILGRATPTFSEICQIVLEAQRLAIAAIRPGMSGKAVDEIARQYIRERGYAGRFGHGLGHGTGLAIHEAPRLSPTSEDVLTAGMVVTVEPGIYLPDWGGVRIENQIAVTDDGAAVLNGLDPADCLLPLG